MLKLFCVVENVGFWDLFKVLSFQDVILGENDVVLGGLIHGNLEFFGASHNVGGGLWNVFTVCGNEDLNLGFGRDALMALTNGYCLTFV